MKKLVIILFSLTPILSMSQARVLNGQRSDGQSWGKVIKDTVRTLVAGQNITITSGGAT
jgi:hypothetical protein